LYERKRQEAIQEELKNNLDRFKLIEAYEDCANVIINKKVVKINENAVHVAGS
jgi:hypothetical protein